MKCRQRRHAMSATTVPSSLLVLSFLMGMLLLVEPTRAAVSTRASFLFVNEARNSTSNNTATNDDDGDNADDEFLSLPMNETRSDDEDIDSNNDNNNNSTNIPMQEANVTARDDPKVNPWQCVPNTLFRTTPYVCSYENAANQSLHPSLLSIANWTIYHQCHVNLTKVATNNDNQTAAVTGNPSREECDRACYIVVDEIMTTMAQPKRCASCALLDNGNIAYDCSNILSHDDDAGDVCAERNEWGDCNTAFSSWYCFLSNPDANFTNNGAPYTCRNALERAPSVPPELPFVWAEFQCRVPTLVTPNLQDCERGCILRNGQEGDETKCNACALLENGTLAYDCSNLFPDAACPQRDVNGVCRDYWHWECTPLGLGYHCTYNQHYPNSKSNPALLYDQDMHNTTTSVYCSNDITGKAVSECQDPACAIVFRDDNHRCASCQLLPNGMFAYDCSNVPVKMTCAILDKDGTCAEIQAHSNHMNRTIQFLPQNDNEGRGYYSENGWILESIDPTVFNVVSDLFAKFTSILVGLTVAILYPLYMTWKIKRGIPIPVDEIGQMPRDFVSATRALCRFSLPALALAVFLLLTEYSHTIADSGLDFVTIQQIGPMKPVLVIDKEKRNHARPMQTAGDPLLPRTRIHSKYSTPSNADGEVNDVSDVYDEEEVTVALASYLTAVIQMASGGSPFTFATHPNYSRVETSFGGSVRTVARYVPGNLPLVEMEKEIPLDCKNLEMAAIKQIVDAPEPFEEVVEHNAKVPTCHWPSARRSGIHARIQTTSQIVETATIFNSTSLGERAILFRKGSSFSASLDVRPESKLLARDRTSWMRGRELYDIDGVVVGNQTIHFARIVVASGIDKDLENREYNLVAEVKACPYRPSGLPTNMTECMAFINLLCETFPEDFDSYHPIYAPFTNTSHCVMNELHITWGRNIDVDADLVSLVAGIAGMAKPNSLDYSLSTFDKYGIFAALFAFGTVEIRPSTVEVIRPRINIVYISFMFLPLVLAVAVLIVGLIFREEQLNVPQTPWHLLVLGKESSLIPTRFGRRGPYPEEEEDLVLVFFDAPMNYLESVGCPDHCIIHGDTGEMDSRKEVIILGEPKDHASSPNSEEHDGTSQVEWGESSESDADTEGRFF